LFELVRDLNTMSANLATSKEQLSKGLEIFDELTGVLGILYNKKNEIEIPSEVLDLVEKRKEARKNKDFNLADELRNKITEYGFIIEETRQGTKISKIEK